MSHHAGANTSVTPESWFEGGERVRVDLDAAVYVRLARPFIVQRLVRARSSGTRIVWMQATPCVPISRCSPARQERLTD
jgi:hypothetical protein